MQCSQVAANQAGDRRSGVLRSRRGPATWRVAGRCDLDCLDSRTSRRYVNQAAWRLGVPWIDGAVDAAGVLARVNAYVPAPEAACMECGWEDDTTTPPPWNRRTHVSPAAEGRPRPTPRQASGTLRRDSWPSSARNYCPATGISARRAPGDARSAAPHALCDDLPARAMPVRSRDLACRASRRVAGENDARAGGSPFRRRFGTFQRLRSADRGAAVCNDAVLPGCGHHEAIALRLADRIPSVGRRCTACGKTMTVRGFDRQEWLTAPDAERSGPCPPALLSRC